MIYIRNLTAFSLSKSFKTNAEKLFLLLKIPKGVEVSMVFAPPVLMRKLNRDYRGKDKPGNVLSFGCLPEERQVILRSGRGLLGEIFICPTIVKKEAAFGGITTDYQLTRLLLHAILHLLGHEHLRPKDADAMERTEKRILKKFL